MCDMHTANFFTLRNFLTKIKVCLVFLFFCPGFPGFWDFLFDWFSWICFYKGRRCFLFMVIQVRERSIEEMEIKLGSMNTALNRIVYLESALKVVSGDFEVKRFIWGELAKLYEERGMFERAGRALANLAGLEAMFKERMDSYVMAAELFCRVGKIEDADQMFVLAIRDAIGEDRRKVKLARKNVYLNAASGLEKKGKRASAVKFYEKLVKMKLDEVEKNEILEKLRVSYNALGMFREARLLGME